MENAGAGVAKEVMLSYPEVKTITICCGTGNNGGDGMVAARHLTLKDREINLLLVGQENKILSEAALQNYNILKQLEQSVNIIKRND